MTMQTFARVLTLLCVLECVSSTVYSPETCEAVCANGIFIQPLPVETGPVENGDNRAYAWAIVAMIQTQINLGILSPPGVGRISAIVGTCLYEAATLVDKYSHLGGHGHHYGYGFDNEAFMRDALDGAGFWAVCRMFDDTDSFAQVYEYYRAFSGMSMEDMVPTIMDYINQDAELIEHRMQTYNFARAAVVGAGAAACERAIQQYTKDGFTPRGDYESVSEPTGYFPVNTPQRLAGITDCDEEIVDMNRWQPLCVPESSDYFGTTECEPQVFLWPWAGRMTPFALEVGDEDSGAQLIGPPPQFGSEEYEEQWREVVDFSANLDDAQKIIAEYWADGPDTTFPPGHTFKIAADAAITEHLSPRETARLLMLVGNAVYDAGISCWRTKTTYDLIRPLQMIQCGARGEEIVSWQGPYLGVGLVNASEWRPYQASNFVTPPFAAYASGHSTFSAAAMEAMRLFFGSDVYRGPACDLVPEGESLFEPKSDAMPGFSDVPNTGPHTIGYVPAEDLVLCWETFTEAAAQAGISRLMGGIHIRADDTSGQRLGRYIGGIVYEKMKQLYPTHGSSHD